MFKLFSELVTVKKNPRVHFLSIHGCFINQLKNNISTKASD